MGEQLPANMGEQPPAAIAKFAPSVFNNYYNNLLLNLLTKDNIIRLQS